MLEAKVSAPEFDVNKGARTTLPADRPGVGVKTGKLRQLDGLPHVGCDVASLDIKG